jgi:phage gpG-like protein
MLQLSWGDKECLHNFGGVTYGKMSTLKTEEFVGWHKDDFREIRSESMKWVEVAQGRV